MANPDPPSAEQSLFPIAVFLSGRRRGQVERIEGKTLRVVVGPDSDIRLLTPDDMPGNEFQATLHRHGESYELEVPADDAVWVNGERVSGSRILLSGDLIEFGAAGPVLRIRLRRSGLALQKTLAEVLTDSARGAVADGHSGLGRASRFLSNVTRGLVTQTSFWFRLWVLVLLTLLVVAVVALVVSNLRLQKQVLRGAVRIEGLAEELQRTGAAALTREELIALQADVERQLSATVARVGDLEAREDAVARVIAQSTPAVVLLLGSYGFENPETGEPLRSLTLPGGPSVFTLESEGEIVDLTFTGTGFLISREGQFLTNRHVAEPWADEQLAELARAHGLEPVMRQLKAYLPASGSELALELIRVSEDSDLAVLRAELPKEEFVPLSIDTDPPRTGEEIVILGYPLGLAGLLVRANPRLLEENTPDGQADFWSVAQLLADEGLIKPLASRGIVAQVTDEAIVYDAETAIGGSGGPVLDLSGRVIAINRAVFEKFGGSNLGVPAAKARELVRQSAAP